MKLESKTFGETARPAGTGSKTSPSERARGWKFLESRAHPWRRELFLKGRRLRPSSVWMSVLQNEHTLEEAAANWDLSVPEVRECVRYCETHNEDLRLDAEEERRRLEDAGVSLDPPAIAR